MLLEEAAFKNILVGDVWFLTGNTLLTTEPAYDKRDAKAAVPDAKPLEEFDLCKLAGKGALYQVAIAAKGDSLTYLEACMRAYLIGRKEPLMLSSGLEDYFLGTYYFDTGRFHADIAGLTHFDKNEKSFSACRFHDDDPIFFQEGLRLTCRCGETEHGQTDGKQGYLNPPKTRYTTYTWVYQW